MHVSDCVQTVYALPLLTNYTASYIICTTWERSEVLTGYLLLGASLAVTGRIRDTEQKVLQTSF
jgi:hypothetical protein